MIFYGVIYIYIYIFSGIMTKPGEASILTISIQEDSLREKW